MDDLLQLLLLFFRIGDSYTFVCYSRWLAPAIPFSIHHNIQERTCLLESAISLHPQQLIWWVIIIADGLDPYGFGIHK